MRKVLVDFHGDTVNNLDTLAKLLETNRNEVIRRSAESAIVLSYVPEEGLRQELLDNLLSLRTVLAETRSSKPEELADRLTRTVAIAGALSAVSIVNSGREANSVLGIYARSFSQHLGTLQESRFRATRDQIEALETDVGAFANLIGKLHGGGEPRPPLAPVPA